MRAFADLYAALDETTRTTAKVAAMVDYFHRAEPADAAWAVYFLTGRKPRQVVPVKRLRVWAAETAGIPDWLFDESYDAVGDLAETIALVLPDPTTPTDEPLAAWVDRLLDLRDLDEPTQKTRLLAAWTQLDTHERFVWNKLVTGAFRVGVSQQLLMRALATVFELDPAVLAHRLMGDWRPTPEWFVSLRSADAHAVDTSRPYPFCLAHPLEGEPSSLGPIAEWVAEWKWDGIRAQVIRRRGDVHIWTRGEELVTERYPEIASLAARLPEGTVLDGEILPWRDGRPLPFAQLQRRIGRKTLGPKILAEVPVVLVAYDLLEDAGRDLRPNPLAERRERLEVIAESLADHPRFRLSPRVAVDGWEELARLWNTSRDRGAEGLMLKRLDSPYAVGRPRGLWWKWKVTPYTIDAVLTAARRGSGKRASLYTDYTFSVWSDDVEPARLVPFAQAYSGLTDAEILRVDAFIRRHMVEKFGPVRTVEPKLVFELAFEAIQRSTRHKSGIAVRFPRILRWREDKLPADADRLATIRALLPPS
jgi:DNA ligase-1